jgi:hypothetical protein
MKINLECDVEDSSLGSSVFQPSEILPILDHSL